MNDRNKVKIAIIDDGILGDYLEKGIHIEKYITLSCENFGSNDYVRVDDTIPFHSNVKLSHGTKVINTIFKYAADVLIEFYVYDIFANNQFSHGALLLEAIKMSIDENVDFIVSSLTCSIAYKDELIALSKLACDKKIIYLAAASNEGVDSYPACLPQVYGVKSGCINSLGSFNYKVDDIFQFKSNIGYELISSNNKFVFFNGTSKATAVVCGKLSSLFSKIGKEKLIMYLKNNHIQEIDVHNNLLLFSRVSGLDYEECLQKIDVELPCCDVNAGVIVRFMNELGLGDLIPTMMQKDFFTIRALLNYCDKQK